MYYAKRREEKRKQQELLMRQKAEKLPPPALAPTPTNRNRKIRPISPIEYDFRGRRVTPKNADQSSVDQKVQQKNEQSKSTADDTYWPANFTRDGPSAGKISVKDLIGKR